MQHPALALLLAEVKEVGLRPDQQTAVAAIEADLEKQADALKEPRSQLSSDLADGVVAGKLDKAKIDADTKKLAQAAESTVATVQDGANRLHDTLDAGQRKKLVELVRDRAEKMHAHAMGPMHGPGAAGHGSKAETSGDGKGPKSGVAASDKTVSSPNAASTQGAAATPANTDAAQTAKSDEDHQPGTEHHGPGSEGLGHPGWQTHMGLDRLSDVLGLTQDQREKLRTKSDALMKSHMSAMKNVHVTMQKRMKAIGEAFLSDKFDAKKAGVGEKHGEMLKNMVKARVEFVEMVLSVLTPEQRTKFAEHIRQHCELCDDGD